MQTKKDLSKSSNNDQHSFLDAFTNLEHKIENMFTHMWHKSEDSKQQNEASIPFNFSANPKLDIIDRDKEVFIKAELPGIDKKDIDVTLSHNRLVIKANTHHEYKEEKGDYLKQEIRASEIYRSVQLPDEVDSDNIQSSFTNGVLELTIPKHERSHRKHIKIK